MRRVGAGGRAVSGVEVMDGSRGLPPMLDINRSSEPDMLEAPAAGGFLVIVAREERARVESLRRVVTGEGTGVIVDRRLRERGRSRTTGRGRTAGARPRADINRW